jgi:hypothetical protein
MFTAYDADLSFEGSSVFWGIQLGATPIRLMIFFLFMEE